MLIKDWKKEILTIPNLLSLFRLLLIPVYMVIYLQAETLVSRIEETKEEDNHE